MILESVIAVLFAVLCVAELLVKRRCQTYFGTSALLGNLVLWWGWLRKLYYDENYWMRRRRDLTIRGVVGIRRDAISFGSGRSSVRWVVTVWGCRAREFKHLRDAVLYADARENRELDLIP